MFPGFIGVAGDDAVELILGGAEVVANEFAEDGAEVHDAFKVAIADGEHRPCGAGYPWKRVLRIGADDAGGQARLAVAFYSPTSDEHHTGFGVVSAARGVFDSGAAELGESDYDDIVPRDFGSG